MSFVEQFHVSGLGHASYLVGDERAGVAMVVDPSRDTERYVAAAAARGVEIRWALDTHGHNDYLSGVGALIEHGAEALAPVGSTTAYIGSPLWHGARVACGDIDVELLHTPGHTPEHTAVLLHGFGASGLTLLSGGSLLAGDVGRPDLLGGVAQHDRASRAMTHTMLDILLKLPDETVVMPTHVGGSLCAAAISDQMTTTIGEQRSVNPVLGAMLRDGTLDAEWLSNELLPPVPAYWRFCRVGNMAGVPAPSVAALELAELELSAFVEAASSAIVLDVRDEQQFAAGHAAGSYNVPFRGTFPLWVGIITAGCPDIVLVADDEVQARAAQVELLRVNEWGARGWLPGVELASLDPGSMATANLATADEVMASIARGERTLVDVRNPLEGATRPLAAAAPLIPAPEALADPGCLPDGPIAISCLSGLRAIIVASAARRAGRDDVVAIIDSPFEAAQSHGLGSNALLV